MTTAEQQKAIDAPGNTLVAAGAGAGKTRTLVERCVRLLLRDRVSVRDILVVTFTEAAAAEVRKRIRGRLEEAMVREPGAEWLKQQFAELDLAQISTLHSFCFTLAREHFYELEIDPTISVLDESEARLLFVSTLEDLMDEHYAGRHPISSELLDFIREQLNGWDKGLREFIRKLHEYTQTRPDAPGWFERQAAALENTEPAAWREWYRAALAAWCAEWAPYLRSLDQRNENAHHCAALLEAVIKNGTAGIASAILQRDSAGAWPNRKKTQHREPFKKLFDEAAFLATLETPEALRQDWNWARGPLKLLLALARQFEERFSEVKRERGVVDFHDLEQFALRLLWDEAAGQPTGLARQFRKRLQAVFVDEYQDINAAQDRIIRALGSEERPGNRFLVGDIKQSIYRFRQADPAIFRAYFDQPEGWTPASLSENFRSHESILNFINPLFRWLMRRDMGGVDYDDAAMLRFGESAAREPMRCRAESAPRVELHLRFKDEGAEVQAEPDAEEGALTEVEDAEREALLVAGELRKMHERGLRIYAQSAQESRRVEWRDMAVLLRSAANKLEIYAKAFDTMQVPLLTRRNAFYTTQEVLDLCSLLHILDNPLQDIPLVAVLRSPIVGLTANELAAIRIASKRRPFWRALNEFHESKKESSGREKIERFLGRYHRWRTARASFSLQGRLELILADTGYSDWLLGQPRGKQPCANVRQLLEVARMFDQARGESLYLFLRYIEELQDAVGDLKPAPVGAENAVSLMTIHQSKGLEFPVVAVADLGKPFNVEDLRSNLLLDEQYGICAVLKPPGVPRRYPSLPLWLARRSHRRQLLGEEMRLLYVALTRAENHLLLFGTGPKNARERWTTGAIDKPFAQQILRTSSSLDWIGTFATLRSPAWLGKGSGSVAGCSYFIHGDETLSEKLTDSGDSFSAPAITSRDSKSPPEDCTALMAKLSWSYPHALSALQAAKSSVTALRRAGQQDEESAPFVRRAARRGNGAERGAAMHAFLEHLSLDEKQFDAASLRAQAAHLSTRGLLQPGQMDWIDFDGVSAFLNSALGRELRQHPDELRRELPFTFKLTAADLTSLPLKDPPVIPPGEFIVVQGVADLVRMAKNEIWVIDFKSDSLEPRGLAAAVEEYSSQTALYALALSSIFARPVTRRGLYFINLREMVWV